MLTDPTVFDEHHLPRQLRHRDAEADHLSRALQPAVDGARAEDVLLTGPSGVGKTVLSRVALVHLAETAPIDAVYLRCLGLTEGNMLQGVLEELDADASSWMLTDLRADLERVVDRPTIVVLDEADGMPDTGMIHHLTGIPKLSLVAICHDAAEWRSRLDEAHRRRFEGEHTIRLERYGVDELADILQGQAQRGLEPGAVDRDQLEWIADAVAGSPETGFRRSEVRPRPNAITGRCYRRTSWPSLN